ncbi:hypothetical protein [Hyphomicrobium sp.]|uniref:hypothetical protein n=1 Tax=Hyphomicrobium sp. TaxID=82 RepID=UPI003F70D2DE
MSEGSTFDPDRFLTYFNSCIDDAVSIARRRGARGGLAKHIGRGYDRPLQKVMTLKIDLQPQRFETYVQNVLIGRLNPERIDYLRALFESYWAAQTLRKKYRNGVKTAPSFRCAVEHLYRLQVEGFAITDLASPDILQCVCEDHIETPRLHGQIGAAVTNLLSILTVVGHARFPLSDIDRAARLSQIVDGGLLAAYQAGNVQALDTLKAAIQKSLRLNHRLFTQLLLAVVEHLRIDFRCDVLGSARHTHAFAALRLANDHSARCEEILGRVSLLSVHHNALKGLSECMDDTSIFVDINATRASLSDHLVRVSQEFRAADCPEGAAFAQLTLAKQLLREGRLDRAERELFEARILVKPTTLPYLTANAALCEALGDFNHRHINKPDNAQQWYREAQRNYFESGSWQRCERVGAKLKAIA